MVRYHSMMLTDLDGDPGRLPRASETYPGPWRVEEFGNGRAAVIDAKGRAFVSVHCSGVEERKLLQVAIDESKPWNEGEGR